MSKELKTFKDKEEYLIKKGKEEGFITYEEIAKTLKGLDVDSDNLDELYNKLIANNIEVISEEENNDDTETELFTEDLESTKDVKINDWEDLIDDIKYGKAFQLLTYAYMYQQKFKTKETMQVANLSFKRLQKNLIQFHTYFGKQKDYDVTPAVLSEYVTVTKKLLEEIFDTTIPFSEVI